jgi:mRNA degradation ribonuclease J1/J2
MQDLGMQKILPDVSFLAEWRDKIEAVVITHGHEDHIGAMPWVVPALDPATPIYAGAFVLQLVTRRLQEYNLYEPSR